MEKRIALLLLIVFSAVSAALADAAAYGPNERRVDICANLATGYTGLTRPEFLPSNINSKSDIGNYGNLAIVSNRAFNAVEPQSVENRAIDAANLIYNDPTILSQSNVSSNKRHWSFYRGEVGNFSDSWYKRMLDMTVVVCSNAQHPRLILPEQFVRDIDDFRVAGDSPKRASNLRINTIAIGILLSLGFVFGGIWFVRNREENKNNLKFLGCFLVLVFLGTFFAFGVELGEETLQRSEWGGLSSRQALIGQLQAKNIVNGKVELLVSDEVYQIILIVPSSVSKLESIPNTNSKDSNSVNSVNAPANYTWRNAGKSAANSLKPTANRIPSNSPPRLANVTNVSLPGNANSPRKRP